MTFLISLKTGPMITLALAADYGAFSAIISLLQGLMLSLSVLGILVAGAIKATAGPNEEKHALAHKMAGACIGGLLLTTFAPDLYDLVFGWAGN